MGANVLSVDYRLEPEHMFPTHVEDCVDAIVQIYAQVDVLGIDSNHLVISGFFAGGGLGLAAWSLLNNAERWGYKIPLPLPKIAGLALFYPSLDQTVSKAREREGLSRQDLL
ncbi:alpha beta hydrolase fold-3 [Fusarium pseudocircinatum]|uniref:Alpha beta hydrolase fold-3 n=1 Tax=Fusarium pseudocircinatum TaxID=56676 RepID=A0A8H5PXL5_9HYPO|nr:alpha beta hydrolase fold-3 [Fusarium pseudocircinatum]